MTEKQKGMREKEISKEWPRNCFRINVTWILIWFQLKNPQTKRRKNWKFSSFYYRKHRDSEKYVFVSFFAQFTGDIFCMHSQISIDFDYWCNLSRIYSQRTYSDPQGNLFSVFVPLFIECHITSAQLHRITSKNQFETSFLHYNLS